MNQDKDLAFLATCKNEDLRTLCDILTYNKNGEVRMSEQLTNSDVYINCYPDKMNLMSRQIGEELRKFGSNTVKTFCRQGEADSYETIVRRVCKRMKVNVGSSNDTQTMERELLTTICEQSASKMSDEELRNIADKAGIPHKSLNKQMLTYVVMMAIRRNTYLMTEMLYYVTTSIAEMLLGRWITMMEQSNNKSNNHYITYNGETLTMVQWARKLNIPYILLCQRMSRGWTFEKAILTPKRKKDGVL